MAEKPRNKQGGANSKKMIFIFMFVDFFVLVATHGRFF
jgi:hypothetical protein